MFGGLDYGKLGLFRVLKMLFFVENGSYSYNIRLQMMFSSSCCYSSVFGVRSLLPSEVERLFVMFCSKKASNCRSITEL